MQLPLDAVAAVCAMGQETSQGGEQLAGATPSSPALQGGVVSGEPILIR